MCTHPRSSRLGQVVHTDNTACADRLGTDCLENVIGLVRRLSCGTDSLEVANRNITKAPVVRDIMCRPYIAVRHHCRENCGGPCFMDGRDAPFSEPFVIQDFVPPHSHSMVFRPQWHEFDRFLARNSRDSVFQLAVLPADGLNWAPNHTHPCIHGSFRRIMYKTLFLTVVHTARKIDFCGGRVINDVLP
jgi:hypothetical protein